jgi:ABC-type lipoprotein release transport system permease subunit
VNAPGIGILGPVAVLVGLFAVGASVIPARRAASVDPMAVLRNE